MRPEAKAALARDWLAVRRLEASTLILPHTYIDVRDLNEAVR
jgi:hypothetical protein